jgi:hypothetical protein
LILGESSHFIGSFQKVILGVVMESEGSVLGIYGFYFELLEMLFFRFVLLPLSLLAARDTLLLALPSKSYSQISLEYLNILYSFELSE